MFSKRSYEIITSFPNFNNRGFNIEDYNKKFLASNVIIYDKTNEINYPEHWGPLSLKCAFNGDEFFKVNQCEFAVNDSRYLILNHGSHYSSYIDSDTKVESFSINFTPSMVLDMASSILESDTFNLESYGFHRKELLFGEQLYVFDSGISSFLTKFRNFIKGPKKDAEVIEYLYWLLLERLVDSQKQLMNDIRSIPKIRLSTKVELYKRLTRAKDYLDSCYNRDISLEELARLSYMNNTYFLRQFRNYYQITPRQYLIKRRMESARIYLETNKTISITEICSMVGYSDLSSFSKLFKQYYTLSPEHYRDIIHR
jgi:AraC family transcriptional regulator